MYHLHNFLGERFERIQAIIDCEKSHINSYANLIGSANYPFPSVLAALNTPFNLNPAEGSRGKDTSHNAVALMNWKISQKHYLRNSLIVMGMEQILSHTLEHRQIKLFIKQFSKKMTQS